MNPTLAILFLIQISYEVVLANNYPTTRCAMTPPTRPPTLPPTQPPTLPPTQPPTQPPTSPTRPPTKSGGHHGGHHGGHFGFPHGPHHPPFPPYPTFPPYPPITPRPCSCHPPTGTPPTGSPPSGTNCALIGTTLRDLLCCNIAQQILPPIAHLINQNCARGFLVNLLSCILQIADPAVTNQLITQIVNLLLRIAPPLDTFLCSLGTTLGSLLNGLPITQVLQTVGGILKSLLGSTLNNLLNGLGIPGGGISSITSLLENLLSGLSGVVGPGAAGTGPGGLLGGLLGTGGTGLLSDLLGG